MLLGGLEFVLLGFLFGAAAVALAIILLVLLLLWRSSLIIGMTLMMKFS